VPAFDLLLRGGTVITSVGRRRADVGVIRGQIAAVEPDLDPSDARVIDVGGFLILPGAIDAHVHPIHGETVASASEAAAFGGVTTVLHHVYPEPGRSMFAWLVELRSEAMEGSWVDFGFHARLRADSPDHLRELPRVADFGVRSFKIFTSYGLPGVAVGEDDLSRIMGAVSAVGGLVLVHAEDQAAIRRRESAIRDHDYDVREYLRARPPSTERDAIEAVGVAARRFGIAVYFVHVSCAAALAAVVDARTAGTSAWVETCPHYLLLDADEVERFGARAKIAPPLRGAADRDELWRGLIDGRVDTVASDHCAYHPDEKEPEQVSFEDAGFGAPGLETLVPLMVDAALNGRISFERLAGLLAESPARIFGIPQKGRIAPGLDADLLVIDPNGMTMVQGTEQHGAAYYSLFDDRHLRGAIQHVILRGSPLLADGTSSGSSPSGRFVALAPTAWRPGSRPPGPARAAR
jgi:dihydropyrimidinase